ncbi:MAG: three-Cys-motif partner protein TcmP, partial [Chthoniobacterales bacterium]
HMHCVFVERNRQYAENLRSVLAAEASTGLAYNVLTGDVQNRLDEALAIAGAAPLFAFLDPFGTALPYGELQGKLLGRGKSLKTEVLLNLNVQMVSRIGGYLTGEETDDEQTSSGRSATLARMDEFLGGTWWQDEFREARLSDNEGSAASAAMHVVEAFRDRVREDSGYASFPVPIRRRPGHSPLFIMLLFYRHPAAPYLFNEATSKANADWRNHLRDIELAEILKAQEYKPTLFDSVEEGYTARYSQEQEKQAEARLETEWIDVISDNIRRLIAGNAAIPIAEQIADIHGTTLGLAREKHFTRAWDRLAEEKVVDPRDKGQKPRNQTIRRVWNR